MRKLPLVGSILAVALLSGCTSLGGLCYPACHSQSRASSSLVDFLYPDGEPPPVQDSIPELKLPLRVGLAFLPSSQAEPSAGLEAARREALLERIRARFADRKFVAEIVVIPEYYLRSERGFAGLEGIQRLYGVDVLGLVSYDQVSYRDENSLSLGYLTIVGAYVLKGNRHDVTTLMDLAIVDPASRSLMLRPGGTHTRRATTTLIGESRATRESQVEGYDAATDRLIENFDVALAKFEADVKAGKANVRVAQRSDGRGGGGSSDVAWLALLGVLVVLRHVSASTRDERLRATRLARVGRRYPFV